MTMNDTAGLLADTAATVLEAAAFIFTEPALEDLEWREDVLEAELDFSGVKSGRLLLAMPKSLAAEVAANLVGLDLEDSPEIAEDGPAAVRELLNMMAGPFLAGLCGEEAVTEIGIPTSRVLPPANRSNWQAGPFLSASLVTDSDQPVEIAAVLD